MAPSFQVCLLILVLIFPVAVAEAQQDGILIVTVRSDSGEPAPQVEVMGGGQTSVTDDKGHATLQVPAGPVEIHLERYGFASKDVRVIVPAGQTARIAIELEAEAVVKEEISVMATRSDILIEDEPLKVEVLDKDEVEEKTAMTPGDVAMFRFQLRKVLPNFLLNAQQLLLLETSSLNSSPGITHHVCQRSS